MNTVKTPSDYHATRTSEAIRRRRDFTMLNTIKPTTVSFGQTITQGCWDAKAVGARYAA